MKIERLKLLAVTAIMVNASGCATVQNSGDFKPKNTSGTVYEESLILEGASDPGLETQQSVALGAFLVGYIAPKVFTFVQKKAVTLLREYADRFEATYSTNLALVDEGVDGLVNNTIPVKKFRFVRRIYFRSAQEAKESLANMQVPLEKYPSDEHGNVSELPRELQERIPSDKDAQYYVNVVSYDFDLEHNRAGTAVKIRPKSFAYRGTKALKTELEIAQANVVNLVIACEIRTAGRSIQTLKSIDETLTASLIVLPIPSLRDPKTGEPRAISYSHEKLEKYNSDWLPAPAAGTYSLKVTASETSKPKEWIEKFATKVEEIENPF